MISARSIGLLAHAVEESVAGVPCGYQDQLRLFTGASTPGVWIALRPRRSSSGRASCPAAATLSSRSACWWPTAESPTHPATSTAAGCGSSSPADTRQPWEDIVRSTHRFVDALKRRDYGCRGRRHEPGDGRAAPPDAGGAGRHRPQAGRGRPPRRVRGAFHRRRRRGLPRRSVRPMPSSACGRAGRRSSANGLEPACWTHAWRGRSEDRKDIRSHTDNLDRMNRIFRIGGFVRR